MLGVVPMVLLMHWLDLLDYLIMIKMFSLVLNLLKVCLCVKLELSVLQDLLCKFVWLDGSRIRFDRSKLM